MLLRIITLTVTNTSLLRSPFGDKEEKQNARKLA